jgi:hypothetical protein
MVSVTAGGWWFLNGHLFARGVATNVRGTVTWQQWTCIFCGGHPHTIGR